MATLNRSFWGGSKRDKPGQDTKGRNLLSPGLVISCLTAYTWDVLLVGWPMFGVMFCLFGAQQSVSGVSEIMIHSDKRAAVTRRIQFGAYVMTIGAIIGMFCFNRWVGYYNAEIVIAAVEEYKSVHGSYPNELEDLVPEFLESIPIASFRLLMNEYEYFSYDFCTSLSWVELPPFGRPGYNFKSNRWTYLD